MRMDAMNKDTMDHYFALLSDTLTTRGLLDKPSQIYNVDESGVPLNPRPPKVITAKGRETKKCDTVHLAVKVKSIVACANATGKLVLADVGYMKTVPKTVY